MKKPLRVIGMNTQHDGGCCLLVDGKIKYAISEERLTRKKSTSGWIHSLKYCLEAAHLGLKDIDLAVFSSYGDLLPSDFDGYLSGLGFDSKKCIAVDHHLSHACSAFLISPFDKALIVVVDGSGNNGDTESYYIGEGTTIKQIGGNSIRETHRGVGKAYEAFTSFLGWTTFDSGTTMALAPYGKEEATKNMELFKIKGDQINSELKQKYYRGVLEFAKAHKVNFGNLFNRGKEQKGKDAAFFIQDRTEKALIQVIARLVKKTGIKNLCLSGGVALNCVANRKILDGTGIENIFIPPAANDKGQALGNALYGYHMYLDKPRNFILTHDYFGKEYEEDEILKVLTKRQELGANFIVGAPEIKYKKISHVSKTAAKLLAEGNIVGWFQGGSEFGPRALGHRSILCDPRNRKIVSRLNTEIKKREPFRPYAPSILKEYTQEFFEFSYPSPFMLLVAKVRKEKRNIIPAVVHIDGTARLQTVTRKDNGIYYQLIDEFRKLTGTPLVLNTSFNMSGEPIVETPKDALGCFLRTGIDYLVMEDYLVWKVE